MKKTLIYPAGTVHRSSPQNLTADTLPAHIALHSPYSASYLYEIRHALVSPYGVVFKNGRAIQDLFIHPQRDSVWRNSITFYKKLLKGKRRYITGDCLLIHNRYYANYYHWVLECLPRLYVLREQTASLKLLVHERFGKFHYAYLDKMPFVEIVRIADNEIVQVQNLLCPTHIPPEHTCTPSLTQEMGAWWRRAFLGEEAASPAPCKRIFVSRERAKHRCAINEACCLLDWG